MAAPSRIQSLSLGSQTLSVAIFGTGKGGALTLDRLAFRALPADPSSDAVRSGQSAYLLEELARASDPKIALRYTISGQSVFTRFVKLPPLGDGKVDQVVEFEAQQNVPFPINEVIWDYQLFTDAASGETEVALVAIKADMLNQINEQVEEAGFHVEMVDVAPMALLNAYRFNYPDVTDPCMLIDIGAKTTNLVFSEPGRIFARSLPIGGATITAAIAKEFHVPFEAAEEKKCKTGSIALGGGYAEDPDPAVAALARVARSSMTRLHAEVVRTINYYRSTLGGNQPKIALLCGGGASLPYTKEFFEEKLGLPVDYFNALRNVAVSSSLAEFAGAHAYRLGEHVGLALRATHACPVEIDLEPDAVALRREVKAKKPLWVTAAACLLAGSLALFGYGHFAKEKAESKAKGLSSELASVKTLSTQIKAAAQASAEVEEIREPMLRALSERRVWPELLNELNAFFASDVLWLVDVEPLKDGQSFMPSLTSAASSRTAPPVAAKPASREDGGDGGDGESKTPANAINALKIRGLWRGTIDNPNAGQDEVRKIIAKLREDGDSPFATGELDVTNKDLVNLAGQDDALLAFPFTVTLSLKSSIPLD